MQTTLNIISNITVIYLGSFLIDKLFEIKLSKWWFMPTVYIIAISMIVLLVLPWTLIK